MNRSTKMLLALGLLLHAACALHAQSDIKEGEVKRIISTLASDKMRGRKTFTPDIQRASAFIESEFAKAGLKPLPGEKNFRQEFSVFKLVNTKTDLRINGQPAHNKTILRSNNTHLDWTSTDSRVEIMNIGPDEDLFKEMGKYLRLQKNAVIWVDAKHAEQFAQFQGYLNNNAKEKLDSSHSLLFVLKDNNNANIDNWSLSVNQRIDKAKLNNVVGILPGRSKSLKGEYVVFSGHYDHLGIIEPNAAKDSIANGADDDASGTTAVITLAQHFKKLHNNARTLVFVAFTAEEMGGFGSHYFSHQLDADSVVAMFNIEMIGKEAKFGTNTAFITGFERSDFGPILQKNLEGTAFKFYPDPYPDQHLFYRSDNATLARLGVPAHTISTDQIDADKDYHQVTDEVKTLDIANITKTIQAIALSAQSIVSGKDTPTRIDKNSVDQ
ncbi:peptidase M28 [Chitinophaga parva]|uniref:Peptidase M28 n=1 Tax=Chitinophaga parva TaxID=2169414 RepID=A0A2T7BK04_9BACT|nr:M20/M25/M40 family metallo-hydrolase [Chitinophaga parva]PUZ27998.1 peptidase M28 [Chitinophaga parva]